MSEDVEAEGALRFAGYAAIFDRIDNGGDIVLPGAFAASLRRLGSGRLPLLWQHRADAPIGHIERVAEDGRAVPDRRAQRAPLETIAARIDVSHYDPARDYQIGLQSAERQGTAGPARDLLLPASLSADAARGLARQAIAAALKGRRRIEGAFDWSVLDVSPGDLVALAGENGQWRVESLDWSDMVPRLALRAHGRAGGGAPGDSGTPLLQGDHVQGASVVALVELPALDGAAADAPIVHAAATGADAGWRRAALFRYEAASAAATPIGPTAPRAVIGIATAVPGEAAPWTIDRRNSVDVTLVHADDLLLPADDAALARGLNLCALGDELLQFGEVTPLGGREFRLSRLVRGCWGTEWAIGSHVAGERFLLIARERLKSVPLTRGDLGASLVIRAVGLGDAVPAEASLAVDGRAMLPPAPVHGRCDMLPAGDLMLRWVRRSRQGWAWIDGGDAPLAEERESYRLSLFAGTVLFWSVETGSPHWIYPADQVAADILAAGGASRHVAISQIGTYGIGRPLRLPLP